jgi:hypothetical protein
LEAIEIKILSSIIDIFKEIEILCNKQNISSGLLDPIRFFNPYKAIAKVFSGYAVVPNSYFELKCKTYNCLIQKSEQSSETSDCIGLTAARHIVQFDKDAYDVIAMIQSLIQIWNLVLESNFDCKSEEFIKQSRNVKIDVWVSGGFYEAFTKHLSPSITNKKVLIEIPEFTVIKKDIQDRFRKIEFYYQERYKFRDILRKFSGRDAHEATKETEECKRAILNMQLAGDNLLHELYHLGDNVRKYLNKCNRIKDFNVIEKYDPYRWCGNYVNYLKHGSRGKNRPSAVLGYLMECYVRKEKIPSIDDKFVDCAFMINIDGRIEDGMDIAQRLIDIWFLFLKYHSDIDLTDLTSQIYGIRRKEFIGKSIYTAKMPDGLLDDARRQAQERKKLNL